jgi:chromate transporter
MTPAPGTPVEVLRAFARLGMTSFGGPIAHLGYFRAEFVRRRGWLSEAAFADIVALSQFLPGPASSQTGFAIGLLRGGYLGGLAAWVGFTLPSALLLLVFAYAAGDIAGSRLGGGILHGLKLVAVAIVAQAVLGMARSLAPERTRASIAILALCLTLLLPGAHGQVCAIVVGGLAGLVFCRGETPKATVDLVVPITYRAALTCLIGFFALLALTAIPLAPGALAEFDAFYRAGALVFGGGHVVLPLLRDAVVAPGWVSDNLFLSGYGAAQAVPGPLFTFAAFLGATARVAPGGIAGGILSLIAIFLPGLLALSGTLPFWHQLRARPPANAAMRGINAAVVGLLGAALYDPVWTSAVQGATDFAAAAAGFVLLIVWQAPPLLVVVLSLIVGGLGSVMR